MQAPKQETDKDVILIQAYDNFITTLQNISLCEVHDLSRFIDLKLNQFRKVRTELINKHVNKDETYKG